MMILNLMSLSQICPLWSCDMQSFWFNFLTALGVFTLAVVMLLGLRSMVMKTMNEVYDEASQARRRFFDCMDKQIELEKDVARLSSGMDLLIDEKDTILAGYQDALNKLHELRGRVRELEGKPPLW